MKEFLQLMRRFVSPYKKYIGWAILLNILSAVFNVFSFTFLIPILSILFKTEGADKVYHFMEWGSGDLADVAKNNFYYYISQMIVDNGPTVALIFLGLFLMVMTLFKTGCYFASSAVMIPLRTGVVRDIRIMVYAKVMRLPMSFFSEERKGDIIARMSGDVGEVENSITSSLDMLMKSPILIIIYFVTLVTVSWQLTLFTIIVLPGMGWLMGVVGRKLKRQSLEAQAKWSDTMSQLEETLGGLRIIKAFIAEDKMINRFTKCSNELRDATNKVAIRQAMAHPMSEFLGTILIVAVLWFGGTLILGQNATIDAPTFIFYMVILYSVINPLKDFAKAGYNIPKGLASMERVDKILKAENKIKEIPNPKPLKGLNDKIEFKDISFSYDGKREVLKHVNLTVPKGKTIALVGQSGSGKSTLLNMLAGLEKPTKGEILIGNVHIEKLTEKQLVAFRREKVGFIFQSYNLLNTMNAIENVALPLAFRGVPKKERLKKAREYMELVGVDKQEKHMPNQMSGGQQQRVGIARALVVKPQIIFADEPTGNLDSKTTMEVLQLMQKIVREQNQTLVMVTHDNNLASYADRRIRIVDGKIVNIEVGQRRE